MHDGVMRPWLTSRSRVLVASAAVAVCGAALGVLLAGHAVHDVGPFESRFSLTPTATGDTVIEIAPLGTLQVDSHDGPLRLNVRLDQLRQADAEKLVRDPSLIQEVGAQADRDVRNALGVLALRAGLAAILGAFLLGLLVFRSLRRAVLTAVTSVALVAATGGIAALSWDPASLREPTYTGLLTNAPAIVGDARDVATQFDVYQRELAKLVTNVSRLYAAASTLPTYQPDTSTVRVLHVSDIHLNPAAWEVIRSIVRQFKIGVIVDSGDLTDHGSAPEAGFADAIAKLGAPYVWVRGNHDSSTIQTAVARQPNAVVLDGSEATVNGIVFGGIGDPRFTPDRGNRDESQEAEGVAGAGEELAAKVRDFSRTPDILVVHDPKMAAPLAGLAPLVLAGHTHKRAMRKLGDGTTLLEQGSTGGAGLRALERDKPTPLECSVLYLDADSLLLQAYDDVTVGGLGESTVTISRTVIPQGIG